MEGRFNRFLNTLLVFSTTVSFMLTAVNTLSFVVNDYQSGKILIDGFTYAVILFSGILYNIVLYIFSREKIKATMHVVFLFFYSLLIFLFCYFTHKTHTAGILIFSLILQYLLQNAVNTVFVFHDSFLKDFEGHDGKDLMQHLFHNNVSGIELAEKIKQQQTTLFTMSFFMLLILFFAQLSQIHFSMAFYLLIILFFICVLLDCFLLGIFKNDIFYGFLGFKNYITDAKKLLLSILIITLLSFGAGFFFSSNKAIIKISFSKTNYEIQNEKKFQDVPSLNSELEMYPLFLDSFREEGKPNYVLRLIGKILKYAFISSLAILTLLFFFKPFFSQHFKDFWKHKKILKYLKTLWNEFIDFLRFTFTKNKKSSLYSTVQSKNFKTIEDMVGEIIYMVTGSDNKNE